MKESQCIYQHYENEINYFEIDQSQCKSNEFCPPIFKCEGNQSCLLKPSEMEYDLGYDTHDCDYDRNCYLGKCNDNKCQGKGFNQTCTSNKECKIGYSCSKNLTCQVQKGNLESCQNDNDCLNNYGCFMNNTCIKYLSLDDGEKVNAKLIFCKSNNALCI